MTASEAKARAEAYVSEREGVRCAIFDWSAREARTHWRFFWNTVAAIEGREPGRKGVAPVAVDKRTGIALFDPKLSPDLPLNAAFPARLHGTSASSREGCRAIAQAWLDGTMEQWSTITGDRELEYGWGFLWQSDKYLRTHDRSHALVGNGPLVVVATTGDLWQLGTGHAFEESVARLEQRLGLRAPNPE